MGHATVNRAAECACCFRERAWAEPAYDGPPRGANTALTAKDACGPGLRELPIRDGAAPAFRP